MAIFLKKSPSSTWVKSKYHMNYKKQKKLILYFESFECVIFITVLLKN